MKPAVQIYVVIYEDLQCPDCAAFSEMLDRRLLPKYGGKVAFEHRDFPLPKHAWARQAAIAARFFGDTSPDLALHFRRHVLENLRRITPGTVKAEIARFAELHGLDPDRAVAALDDDRLEALVETDIQEGIARGVTRTPTVLVNRYAFIERFTLAEISAAIDSELAAGPR